MNRKHKINLWLVFFVAALFVASAAMSAMGNVVSNDVEKSNLCTTNDETVNVGSIYIGDNEMRIGATDKTVDLGRQGGDLEIKVEVEFDLIGWCDHGYAYLIYGGKTVASDNDGGTRDAELVYTLYDLSPGDQITVTLKGKYEDCINEDFERSKSCTITIKYYTPEPKLDVSPNTLTDTGLYCSKTFKVKNVGDSGTTLSWNLEIVSQDGEADAIPRFPELEISPMSGNGLSAGGFDTVEVEYDFPRGTVADHFSWRIKVTSSTTGESEYVNVNFNSGTKARSSLGTNLQLFTRLQAHFPQMFTFLQRLPAFQ